MSIEVAPGAITPDIATLLVPDSYGYPTLTVCTEANFNRETIEGLSWWRFDVPKDGFYTLDALLCAPYTEVPDGYSPVGGLAIYTGDPTNPDNLFDYPSDDWFRSNWDEPHGDWSGYPYWFTAGQQIWITAYGFLMDQNWAYTFDAAFWAVPKVSPAGVVHERVQLPDRTRVLSTSSNRGGQAYGYWSYVKDGSTWPDPTGTEAEQYAWNHARRGDHASGPLPWHGEDSPNQPDGPPGDTAFLAGQYSRFASSLTAPGWGYDATINFPIYSLTERLYFDSGPTGDGPYRGRFTPYPQQLAAEHFGVDQSELAQVKFTDGQPPDDPALPVRLWVSAQRTQDLNSPPFNQTHVTTGLSCYISLPRTEPDGFGVYWDGSQLVLHRDYPETITYTSLYSDSHSDTESWVEFDPNELDPDKLHPDEQHPDLLTQMLAAERAGAGPTLAYRHVDYPFETITLGSGLWLAILTPTVLDPTPPPGKNYANASLTGPPATDSDSAIGGNIFKVKVRPRLLDVTMKPVIQEVDVVYPNPAINGQVGPSRRAFLSGVIQS